MVRASLGVAVASVLLLWGWRAGAAVSRDPVSTFDAGRFTATVSFPHTVGAGADRYLIVAVFDGNLGTTVTTVTYGGAALTRIGAARGSNIASELWALTAPPTGAHAVAVALDSSNDRPLVAAISFAGVDQSAPAGTPATASGTGNAISVAVGALPGDYVLDAAGVWTTRQGVSATASAGQAELWNIFNGTDTRVMGSSELATGPTTMSWTVTGQQPTWATIAVPLRAAAAAPPDAALADGSADVAPLDAPGPADARPTDARPADAGPADAPGPADAHGEDGIQRADDAVAVDGLADAGGPPDAPLDGREVAPDTAPARARALNLRVGSACAVSGGAPGAFPLLLAVTAVALRGRRRSAMPAG
jgi:hypothetical protein